MVKLIVSDFDGTLMPYGAERVSDKVKEYINSALEKGITVAVSSGRTYSELAALLPEFKDHLYFICADGAYYMKNENVLYERPISDSNLASFVLTCDRAFVYHGAINNYYMGNLPEEAERFGAKKIARVREIKEKIFKITTYGYSLQIPPYCALRMHWDGGKNQSAQYVNRFSHKGAALSDLQMRLMLTKFDTVCIGDSGNDVAMMHNAKRSFCIGTRSEALLKICTDKAECIEDVFEEILKDEE